MAEIVLAAETGRPTGSGASKRLRTQGKVPGVVYGTGGEAVAVAVDWRALRQVLTTDAGLNALINLEVNGERQLTMVKELQRHPTRRDVLHVDFLRVRRDQPIVVDVPLVLTGEAEDVHKADGVVEQTLYALSVHALPADIPDEIQIDVNGLQVGDTIRVADLALPAGVTTDLDPEDPLVMARFEVVEVPEPEVPEEEAAEAAEGEAAEGEAAEAAEGAPAEGEGAPSTEE